MEARSVCSAALPGNSLTLVSDPPGGRVKSLWGIHLFGFGEGEVVEGHSPLRFCVDALHP